MVRRLLLLILVLNTSGLSAQLIVGDLRCDSRSRPPGMEKQLTTFSWQIKSTRNNMLQVAYRIVVGMDSMQLEQQKKIVWDSKKFPGSNSIHVKYAGPELKPGTKYFWKVMIWDNYGRVSSWSKIHSLQTGLSSMQDWAPAKWITYDEIVDTSVIIPHAHQGGKKSWGARRNILPLFRREFVIERKIKNATAFVCGLGHFELFVNGTKSGDHFLDPGWTDYAKHAQYVTFDISQQLTTGLNTVGLMLGNGFYYIPGQRYRKMTGAYGLPKMIIKIVVDYTDGSTSTFVSDERWKTAPSPIIFSSIFGGEDYDARLEQQGWNRNNFNDAGWKNAPVTTGPELRSQITEPVRIMETFTACSRKVLPGNVFVYDFCQNASAIPSIRVRGHAGDTIRIIPGELLNDDGTVNQRASGSPSYFTYILKGSEMEEWSPRFMYYGYRYLQVNLIAKDSAKQPEVIEIQSLHVRNSAASTGKFATSLPLFNKTNTLIDWAVRSNMMSVLTDCPHREKLGWLEQTYLMGASIHYTYDIETLCHKIITDMQDAQHEDGKIPEIAPEYTAFTSPFDESPEWGSACIILPWYAFQWYGDTSFIRDAYPMMKKYLQYLRHKRDTGFLLTHGLGDWYDIGPDRPGFSQMTTQGVTATATYYYDLTILTQVAVLLGINEDADEFQKLSVAVKIAFNKKFYNLEKGYYDRGSQTANAIALYCGLVEPGERDRVLTNLINDIRTRNNALTAGDIGFRYLVRVLEDAGRHDVIMDMNNRSDVPGYGYQLNKGATALTESWQALPSVSNNHLMLGHLQEWFYSGLCGIRQSANGSGYREIELKPATPQGINFANATFQSPYGLIYSRWQRVANQMVRYEFEIPPNTKARVMLPGGKVRSIGSGKYVFLEKAQAKK